jgi:hypothetical protein
MAARLRAQIASLTTDLSANKISDSVTSSGLLDVSSNLYRVAQFDASRNANLSNVTNINLGPTAQISHDLSNNLVLATAGNKASISVDANKRLVMNSGLNVSGVSITVDASRNLVIS